MASVTKRTWIGPSGEEKVAWRVKFYVGSKEKARQFPTERKARKFLESVSEERKRLEAQGIAYNTPTFKEVAENWLSARKNGTDGNPPLDSITATWYRGQLTNHILPRLGRLRIGEIDRKKLKEFRTQLLSEPESDAESHLPPTPVNRVRRGRPRNHTGKLSRKTSRMILTTVRQILGYAIEEEIIERDPSDRLSIRLGSRNKNVIEIHSIEEMKKILLRALQLRDSNNQTVAKPWKRYYPMLLISVYCGLRISEIRGLDCKNIDFASQVIRVRQRADAKGVIGPPKSAKGFREVHYPQVLDTELRRYIGNKTEGLVFCTKSGRPVDTANFRKRCWEAVQKSAGVRVMTLHSARHFFASRQIADGVNPKELSDVLGHADEAFTLRVYGHLFQDRETVARRKQRVENLVLV